MSISTTIKSEVFNRATQTTVTAKIYIEEDEHKDFYLSELNEGVEDGEEEDHLVMERVSADEIYINGKLVNRRILDEIIRFIS